MKIAITPQLSKSLSSQDVIQVKVCLHFTTLYQLYQRCLSTVCKSKASVIQQLVKKMLTLALQLLTLIRSSTTFSTC